MKKNYLLLIIGVALAFMTSCKKKSVDDPNVPYPGDLMTLPYTETFENHFGTYTRQNILGEQEWVIDYETAKMAGSVQDSSGTYVNYANEDWLISSPINIGNVEHAKMVLTYIGCYFNNINNDVHILASTDYSGSYIRSTATWNDLNAHLVGSSNWDNWQTIELSLDDYIGKTTYVAVRYISNTDKAGTIEIKSISVEEGQASGAPVPSGDVHTLPYYQGFTSEFGSYITKDVLGEQSWMIDFSTAKMTGYVGGTNYANEDWLISSPVSVTDVEHAMVEMSYIARYFKNLNEDLTIWASKNYTYGEMPETAEWTKLNSTLSEGSNWNDFIITQISLDEFIGDTITIAVKYASTDEKAGTIEIQSLTIAEGQAGGGGGGQGGETQYMPYTQDFSTEFGTYCTQNVFGPQEWMIDFSTAKMTGFVSGINNANEDWLISSPVAITGVDHAKMVVNYIARYFNDLNTDITVWASANYDFGESPMTAIWEQVSATFESGSNWNDFKTAEINLDNYIGQNVTLAVKYLSDDVKAGTIEIQSISIEEGEASGGGVTPTPPTPGPGAGSGTADDPYNVASGISLQGQDVVAWVQGYIVGAVKNGLTTVSSNDDVNWNAPFDSYTNVVIADDADCREIANCIIVNLPSGKPLRAQVNLFDNPDNYGKLLSVNGKLRTYFGQAGLRDSGGTENDFVLEGGVTPTPPTPGTIIFSETFATGQGQFVIEDVLMPEELTYVWAYASNYSCMKASAYVGQAFETESWLVSPAIDLSNVSTATLKFDQAVNYAAPAGALFVMISTNYNGDVESADWTELNLLQWPAGNNWTFVNSIADLSSYVGQTVTIAFKYTSSTSTAATWELKNFVVEE